MRFRRKPVHVDAVQLTQDVINAHVLDGAPLPEGCRVTSSRFNRIARTVDFVAVRLKNPKLELVMPGDWIVRAADGTFGVCRPDEFEALYEPDPDPLATACYTPHATVDNSSSGGGFRTILRDRSDHTPSDEDGGSE